MSKSKKSLFGVGFLTITLAVLIWSSTYADFQSTIYFHDETASTSVSIFNYRFAWFLPFSFLIFRF